MISTTASILVCIILVLAAGRFAIWMAAEAIEDIRGYLHRWSSGGAATARNAHEDYEPDEDDENDEGSDDDKDDEGSDDDKDDEGSDDDKDDEGSDDDEPSYRNMSARIVGERLCCVGAQGPEATEFWVQHIFWSRSWWKSNWLNGDCPDEIELTIVRPDYRISIPFGAVGGGLYRRMSREDLPHVSDDSLCRHKLERENWVGPGDVVKVAASGGDLTGRDITMFGFLREKVQ